MNPYIPENGERVWIKVFSNWSIGTYIGLDYDKINHLAREPKEAGGHILRSTEILPITENPNNDKHKKDSWNREEIIALLRIAFNAELEEDGRFEKWIEENL